MPAQDDFQATFARLRDILKKHAPGMIVQKDTDEDYYLDTPYIHPKNKQPIFFAAVQIKKNYVSFHLMPVYACPGLLQGMSKELKARMQGKACFNFKTIDEALFKE